MILLDTNVISELIEAAPNPAVVAYMDGLAPAIIFTAAICEAGFQDQVLRFDRTCAALYGKIRQAREAAGKPIAVEDAMIAATARAYGAVIATRNTSDFIDCGVPLIDPWLAA
jgi:predicted nucleic acid-binding protein